MVATVIGCVVVPLTRLCCWCGPSYLLRSSFSPVPALVFLLIHLFDFFMHSLCLQFADEEAKRMREEKRQGQKGKKAFAAPSTTLQRKKTAAAAPSASDDDEGAYPSSNDSDSEEKKQEGRGGRRGRGRAGASAINAATGLPHNATAEELLAAAAADQPIASLFSEVVFEHEFAVKAAAVFDLLRRATARVSEAEALGVATGTGTLPQLNSTSIASGTVAALRASSALEDFTRSLAANYAKLKLPPVPQPRPAPYHGKVDVGYADAVESGATTKTYSNARLAISKAIHTAHPRAIRVLRLAMSMWAEDYAHRTFMRGLAELKGLQLPCNVRDYVKMQQEHVSQLGDKLSNVWLRDVANSIVDGLPPSHFNVFEQDWPSYEASATLRMVNRIQLLLANQLRGLVTASMESLVTFVNQFMPDARSDTVDAVDAIMRVGKTPLFSVELVLKRPSAAGSAAAAIAAASAAVGIDEDGKADEGGATTAAASSSSSGYQVLLSPSKGEISRALLGTVAATVSHIRALKGIERRVMTLLPSRPNREPGPILNIGCGDELCSDIDGVVGDTKAWLKSALADSLLAAPLALAAKLQKCAWLAEADATSIVKTAVATAKQVASEKVKAEEEAAAARAKVSCFFRCYG